MHRHEFDDAAADLYKWEWIVVRLQRQASLELLVRQWIGLVVRLQRKAAVELLVQRRIGIIHGLQMLEGHRDFIERVLARPVGDDQAAPPVGIGDTARRDQ